MRRERRLHPASPQQTLTVFPNLILRALVRSNATIRNFRWQVRC